MRDTGRSTAHKAGQQMTQSYEVDRHNKPHRLRVIYLCIRRCFPRFPTLKCSKRTRGWLNKTFWALYL
ncbi:hypothetical protein I7I53_11618 [Histoplasma capsulatum var. duboisii H88]|uniref:Uncharacterized protein n=1 Tax=Ajellomyces capsulatus (strain H88) TaxID=544711 RepID=A0A8A1LTL1_AJEC8|nr:hypothetical protein I7I53_11618 [Histoplasma capsulatum var. duboisii H88]